MSNNLRIGLAFILVVVGLFGESTIGWFKDNVEVVNEPEVKITEPSCRICVFHHCHSYITCQNRVKTVKKKESSLRI